MPSDKTIGGGDDSFNTFFSETGTNSFLQCHHHFHFLRCRNLFWFFSISINVQFRWISRRRQARSPYRLHRVRIHSLRCHHHFLRCQNLFWFFKICILEIFKFQSFNFPPSLEPTVVDEVRTGTYRQLDKKFIKKKCKIQHCKIF